MAITLLPNVEELTWEEAQKTVIKGGSELYKILNGIDPGKKYTFIRVRYPFGAIILHDDEIYLPFDRNHSIPLSDPEIPTSIKEKLGYRSLPFGMITANSVEIYRETSDRVFSLELTGPNKGIELGIFEYFGLTPCYSVSSGARSLFMIPKISETRNHKKLMKHMQVSCGQPKNIFKHWHVFKELYNSSIFGSTWESEILYLTKAWDDGLRKHKQSPAWAKFEGYIYKKCFEYSELARKKLVLDFMWQKIAAILENDNHKTDMYTIDTLKHLIYIYLGGVSGSRPSVGNYAGPINTLQTIYIEHYGLNQIPTIMEPQRFSLKKNIPVYYSMQFPTMISPSPTFRKVQTIIEEMRELMIVKSALVHNQGNIKVNNIKLHDLVKSMKLEFYHGDLYSYGKEIRPTHEIPAADPDFLFSPIQKDGLEFADNGSFIRGCIKISKYENS